MNLAELLRAAHAKVASSKVAYKPKPTASIMQAADYEHAQTGAFLSYPYRSGQYVSLRDSRASLRLSNTL